MSQEKQSKFPARHYDPMVEEMIKAYNSAVESGASPDVIKAIEKAVGLALQKDGFMDNMTSRNSEACARMLSEAHNHDWEKALKEGKISFRLVPRMVSGTLEGQFLKSFLSVQKAKRVLEIGMFTGFSALSMAEALPADGQVVTIDRIAYLEGIVQPSLDLSPHGKKVKIIIGDAIQTMKDLAKAGEKFDAIFMDADKSQYEEYFKICMDDNLLAPRGTLIVDNAFQHGGAYDPDRGETVAKSFAAYVDSQQSLHKAVVPIRDGVYIIRRLSDVEGSVA